MSDNCKAEITPIFENDICNRNKINTLCVLDPSTYTELELEANSNQNEVNQAIYQAFLAQKGKTDSLQEELDNLPSGGGVYASSYKITALNPTPSSSTDLGTLGEIRWDANYMYVCVATNTWKRSAITTW